MEKLTKENIYIDLRGKSKEELTELWKFLVSIGEKQFRTSLRDFLANHKGYETYNFGETWTLGWYLNSKNKQEVTIHQLKEILQPMETLQEQLQKAQLEVERLQNLIEEENKPKVGDWFKRGTKIFKVDNTHCLEQLKKDVQLKKITNPELIKLLEDECNTKN